MNPAMNPPALSVDLPHPRRSPVTFDAALLYILFGFLGALGYASYLWMPPKTSFTYLTLLMLVYLGFEIWRFARLRPSRWLVQPVVISSIFVFGLPFGVSNVLYYLPERYSVALLSSTWGGSFEWMNVAMLMALLGAFCMWRGFYSQLGGRCAAALRRSKLLTGVLRQDYEVRLPVIFVLVAVSLGSRMLMIRFGIFGYNSEMSRLYDTGRFSQFLQIGASLGTLALILASLNYFYKAPGHRLARILTFLLLALEIAFGVASGMKSQVVLPLLVVGTCMYIAGNRIPRWVLITAPILLVFAYRVIEPFRDLRYQDPNYQNRSLTSIVDTIKVSASEEGSLYLSSEGAPMVLQLAKRLNLTMMASLAIEFKELGRVTDEDPKFLRDILYSPAYAVVPRFLWPSKPYGDVGSWFNRTVLAREFDNAVGMSPVGFLYLAGGGFAVAFAFFFIGTWQRILSDWLLSAGSGGCLLFISQLKVFIFMPTAVYPLVIAAIRTLPMVVVAQLTAFKR